MSKGQEDKIWYPADLTNININVPFVEAWDGLSLEIYLKQNKTLWETEQNKIKTFCK